MSGHTYTDARHLSAVETSKLIRGQLKAAFPRVKFSVRTTDRGTIYVKWTDGPTSKRVEEIAGQFEGKGFDGMIDLEYHIDGWLLNGAIVGTRSRGTADSRGCVTAWGMIAPHDDCELVSFGAGYIFTTRDHSAAFTTRLVEVVAKYWGLDAPAICIQKDGTAYVNATTAQDQEAFTRTGRYWGALVGQAANDRSAFHD